ncbi:hypothetical protein [Streptomyces sp. SPB4]|uniref:hypothetical protein n=1 Tax=Streptomyces sp. SPB4 TaxID=2940553 RepID=UPI002474F703|nr:hypothetical protein [Streptomyces sp. SPB4]MDH6542719.1 hypothetical protein [Streptomyces sp. SPB4]
MTVPRLLAPLGGLLAAGPVALAEAPWWVAATLAFGGLLVLRAEALVNARNEARRGLHEHRLLGEVPRRQALAYLREVRRDRPDPAAADAGAATGTGTGAGAA